MGKKWQNIWVERGLIESKAFAALRTATTHRVLFIFYTKRQFEKTGRRGKEQWTIKNNGEITFTYKKEAKSKYGISESAFRLAIDELISKGFIDIAASGQGTHKVTTLYAISNRWREYGTPEYKKPQPRPKKPINRGFQRGNQFGRNCGQKKKSTVIEQHSSTVAEQHSGQVTGDSCVRETT
jgi:hypothetical protein